MIIVRNAYVTRNAAYHESGGIIVGTQRIPLDHQMPYWQQANLEIPLAIKVPKTKLVAEAAIYTGRIPMHFGHFLLEGLPRMCDAVDFPAPMIGYITPGLGVKESSKLPLKDIKWVIEMVGSGFVNIAPNAVYKVETLYVPELPLVLSRSCAEPWRMTPLIARLVNEAHGSQPRFNNMYLRKTEEHPDEMPAIGVQRSDPRSSLQKQIYAVSKANFFMAM